MFAVGACRSDSRDPLRSADSHVPPGQSFVRVFVSFEREFLFFFGEFKNSVINGIKISENENLLKVNKMEMNEIIGTKKKCLTVTNGRHAGTAPLREPSAG